MQFFQYIRGELISKEALTPAFDVIYAHNPDGPRTHQHQMSIHGKRDRFTIADLLAVGKEMNIKSGDPIVEFGCISITLDTQGAI